MKNYKTGIFYFSGTGNSLYVAKKISKELKDCELLSIPKELKSGDLDYEIETLGFVVPTYYLGLPEIVHRFIHKINVRGVKYVFLVSTKGWSISGGAVQQLNKRLKEKDFYLDYGVSVVMPFNDFHFGKVDSSTVQEKKLSKCETHIARIINDISHKEKKIVFEPFSLMTPLRNKGFIEKVNKMDQYFKAVDTCSGCGRCEKVCPVDNIQMVENRPEWMGKCQFCLACYNYCPGGKIEFQGVNNEDTYYRNPKITVEDMIQGK